MYKRSTNNIKFDNRIITRLEQALHSIRALYDGSLIEVCLFGSYAKGHAKHYSSIDLLIILDQSEIRFLKRNVELQRLLNEDDKLPLVEPLIYTQDEILELLKKKESFIVSVIKESVVLMNDFNDINLNELTDANAIPSRYINSLPPLEEIDL